MEFSAGAHFALVTGLRTALLRAERPRVVAVSSGAHLLAGFDFEDPQFERKPYDSTIAYAQSKTADVLLAVGISRRWARDGIHANACAPGQILTNLLRHLDAAASPLLQGVTGRYFENNQETPVVEGGPHLMAAGGPEAMVNMVAEWAVDPAAADRLWEDASVTIRDAADLSGDSVPR